MTVRGFAAATALLTIGLGALLLLPDREPYRLSMQIPNANGLREGSDVKVGGTIVGRVADVSFGARDVIEVQIEVDENRARVGRGVSAAIRAANLLGQKYVDLRPGDRSAPLPSGSRVPASRIATPVDLDEIFSVLDADTRTRLGVLINEAGTAFTGRRADFNTLLGGLPSDLRQATRMVDDLASDNHTLRRLVARSERLVSRIAPERRSLSRVVHVAGETMRTVAARRPQLTATLRQAPGTLAVLRRFLADLRSTTAPLGPAARTLGGLAPSLTTTLAAVEPFRAAAAPALHDARRSAPALETLGVRASPVVGRARPTVAALSALAAAAPPLTSSLGTGIDDILGFVQGWARAIQTRDGISHLFSGHIALTPESINSAVRRLAAQQQTPPRKRRKFRERRPSPVPSTQRPATSGHAPKAPTPKQALQDTLGVVGKLLDTITDRLPGGSRKPENGSSLQGLLDHLLKP
jgi:phospholipid/cholesterol/gamma-HCH transport system substrate-binding protein